MGQEERIQNAYRGLGGKRTFYDGMITCSTLSGRAVCRLVYQDGTPGVSSRHCQIFFDEQENLFVVTDLNSTYGTFLADGQRLAPNTPVKLAPRSSIYLGEVANTIYLELE